jgi:hypothetical protein
MMSKRIRVIFYITPWVAKLKYWVNWLISIRTFSKYSHVEFWTMDDSTPMLWYDHYNFTGKCWAATMRGEDTGTVKRNASKVLKHPKNWHFIEIEIDTDFETYPSNYEGMINYMQSEVDSNNGYSKWDILKFISPIHIPDNKRNICSEYVNNGLYMAGIFDRAGIVSPGKLHRKLKKLGYKTKSLVKN